MKVCYECAEFGLGEGLEGFDGIGGYDQGGVVGIGVDCGSGDCMGDIVYIQEEESGG